MFSFKNIYKIFMILNTVESHQVLLQQCELNSREMTKRKPWIICDRPTNGTVRRTANRHKIQNFLLDLIPSSTKYRMATTVTIAGLSTFELKYYADATHFMYGRIHTKPKKAVSSLFPDGRTLFIVNVPPDATERELSVFFSSNMG